MLFQLSFNNNMLVPSTQKRLIDGGALASYPSMMKLSEGTIKDPMMFSGNSDRNLIVSAFPLAYILPGQGGNFCGVGSHPTKISKAAKPQSKAAAPTPWRARDGSGSLRSRTWAKSPTISRNPWIDEVSASALSIVGFDSDVTPAFLCVGLSILGPKLTTSSRRRGGIPDRDAPHVLAETKFWCAIEEERVHTTSVAWLGRHFMIE